MQLVVLLGSQGADMRNSGILRNSETLKFWQEAALALAELVSHVCAVGDVDTAESTLVALNQVFGVYRYIGAGI